MRKVLALVVVGLVLVPFADRPRAQNSTWRPVVMTMHGMVASGHPLASEAGLRVLKAGGNAVDAAVAAWAVQTQVEPGSTSLGGDWLMMVYLAKTGEVKFINGSGFAPQAATIDFYKSKGGHSQRRSADDLCSWRRWRRNVCRAEVRHQAAQRRAGSGD
jgi:gamma-glutamyltranspeptidase/glutathione hydrolase